MATVRPERDIVTLDEAQDARKALLFEALKESRKLLNAIAERTAFRDDISL